MTHSKKRLVLSLIAFSLATGLSTLGATAGSYSDSGSYNGYGAYTQNQPSNYSLRDSNGNLTVVDGQFTSSNYGYNQGYQQSTTSGGVGTSGAGAAYGQASAVGNQLNVVTVGNNNTVVVDSTQINNGNQNASVQLNGH